jgi:hypothetical protein
VFALEGLRGFDLFPLVECLLGGYSGPALLVLYCIALERGFQKGWGVFSGISKCDPQLGVKRGSAPLLLGPVRAPCGLLAPPLPEGCACVLPFGFPLRVCLEGAPSSVVIETPLGACVARRRKLRVKSGWSFY